MHSKKTSISKSLTWRIIGIALLAFVTWMVTRNLITVTVITILHHAAFAIIFYVHDRVWREVVAGWKVWLKSFTYEIILGFTVLGFLTWIFTGSWKAVTLITVIYLPTRYVLFPIHERWYVRRSSQTGDVITDVITSKGEPAHSPPPCSGSISHEQMLEMHRKKAKS